MALLRRPPPRVGGTPLWRLMLGELRWAVRQAIHPAKMVAASLVAIAVGAMLGPTTPGPVLDAGWRLAAAVVLGLVTVAVAHALLQRNRPGEDDHLRLLRVIVASVALLVVATIVLGNLLAVIAGSPPSTADASLSASLDIDAALLGGAALLLAGVLAASLGTRVAIPGSLLFLALGMVIGDDGFAWVELSDAAAVQSISVVALVVILFDGGLSTDARNLRQGIGPGLALATVGVAITAGITAVGTMWLLDVPSRVAWLIGAIVASTDATAVFALLRRTPLPERVASIIQIESGANDPVAVLLTVGLLSAWDAPPTASAWLAFGAVQLVGGVAVGFAVGAAGSTLLRRLELGTAGLYPVLALGVAGASYGVAAAVGASGFLATYIAGIVVAFGSPRRRGGIRSTIGALSSGAEVGLFLLLGLLVFPSRLPSVAAVSLGVTALLVLVARPLATWVCLAWFDLEPREVVAVSWLGMRGAVPIVLATLALSAGIESADAIFDVVFFVVVTSALVQGMTATGVLRRLGLGVDGSTARTVVEALPLDEGQVDVIEVVLTRNSPLVGDRLAACPPPEDAIVSIIVREDRALAPRGTTRLQSGDRLLVTTTNMDTGVHDIEVWALEGVSPPLVAGSGQPD